MRWRLARGQGSATAVAEPMVLAVTSPLTRETAAELVHQVRGATDRSRVIIDLTGIAAFDSDGAEAIAGLQEQIGPGRLTVVGFRQAAERLLGSDHPVMPAPAAEVEHSPW